MFVPRFFCDFYFPSMSSSNLNVRVVIGNVCGYYSHWLIAIKINMYVNQARRRVSPSQSSNCVISDCRNSLHFVYRSIMKGSVFSCAKPHNIAANSTSTCRRHASTFVCVIDKQNTAEEVSVIRSLNVLAKTVFVHSLLLIFIHLRWSV